MATSSFNSVDYLSQIRQREQSNESFFQDSMVTQSPSSTVTEPFASSMNGLFYPSMLTQHYPAPPGPNFSTSSSIPPPNVNYLGQNPTQYPSTQLHSATESLAVDYLSPGQNTAWTPPSASTTSVQKTPAPNGNVDITQK
ncbi:hypothetical protein N7517_000732 [Penicillium concentricum]|uniref:Uncharacterized protein n=1 Tax=Penicillium concentricum TaxID=293559 RepID=A0A9W9SQR0_9EURO|nr:uncharacterized protein N7517_000732 [Penicillium concentricum]KAJ5382821.1 hypothetical protein N7517_000732 [Penicillium concentricum]